MRPNNFVSLVRGVLDGPECAAVVRRAEAMGIARTGRDYPPSYRDNDRVVIDDPALAEQLFRRVRAHLPAERDGGWKLARLNERFRVCRYTNGQSFRVHRDGAYARDGARSFLTLQIYLNDAATFVGGATRFYSSRTGECAEAVRAEEGMAVVFEHDAWHDGEAVPSGTKYVLRTDVVYEREGTFEGHRGYVFAIAACGEGFATGSRDRTIRIWEPANVGARCTRVLEGHRGSIAALIEARPGVLWSGSRDHTVREWNGDGSRVLGTHDGAVLSLAKIGDRIASAGADACVRLWSRYGEALGTWEGHAGWIWSVASTGDHLVTASEDGTLRVWDVRAGAAIDAAAPGRGPVHAVTSIRAGVVAAGFADGSIVTYAIERGRLAATQIIEAHRGEVYALDAYDGYIVSGGEDDMARVHRMADGALRASIAHGGFVRAVTSLGDGLFASGGYDEHVRVWTLKEVSSSPSATAP